MTIYHYGKEKICQSVFYLEKQLYVFSFNGKKGMPFITDKKLAREYEVDLKRQLRSGTFITDSPMQVFGKFYKDAFMDYSKHHKSQETQMFDEYYGRSLLREFGGLRFSQITPRMIERYLLKLSQTKTKYGQFFAPVTVRMHYDRLNQTFNMAIRDRVINDNPCRLVNKNVLKEFPTWQKRERWLNKYSEQEEGILFAELNPTLKTICTILLNTGLRPPKEILGIEKEHINLSDKTKRYKFEAKPGVVENIMIPPNALFVARAKDGRTRVIPLNQTMQATFRILSHDATVTNHLFLNRAGQPLGSIKRGWQRACERAEIDDLRPYDLRHTFATRLIERGWPLPIISALLGHSMPTQQGFGFESRITPGYAHATWETLQWAVTSLEKPPVFRDIYGKSSENQVKEGENEDTGRHAQAG